MSDQGEHYNLREIYAEMNKVYFGNKIDLKILWFGSKNFVPKRHILLGSYHRKKGLIKIHRLLDRASVPSYFINYIMYHEMLHHVEPPIERWGKKRRIHHRGFVEKEKEFKEYALAQEFRKVIREEWFKPGMPRIVRRKRTRKLGRIFFYGSLLVYVLRLLS